MPHTTRKGGTKRHKAPQPASDQHYSALAAAPSVPASHPALPGPSRFAPSAAYVATRNPAPPPVSGYGYQPPPGYPAPPPAIAARLPQPSTSALNWHHQQQQYPPGYPPYPQYTGVAHAVSGSGSYYTGNAVAPPAPLPLVHPPPPHFSYGERRSFSRTPSIGTSRDASPARHPHEGRSTHSPAPVPAPAPASTSAPPHTVVYPNPAPKRPIPPPPPAPYHAPPLSPAPAISAPPPATPATAQADFIAFLASTPAVSVPAVEESSSSDSSSSSYSDDDSDSSSDDPAREASIRLDSEHDDRNNDDDDEDSDEEAVADALVGARRNSSAHLRDQDRDLGDRSMAPPPPSSLFGGSVSDSSSDSDSSDEDEEEVEHVSDIEEAVLEQVGDEDDVGADETLPFDFESASEDSDDSEGEETAGEEAEGTAGDESLEPIRPRASNRKRQRVDSVGSDLTAEFEVDSRSTSRAGSSEPVHTLATGPSDESIFIARAIAPALSPPARSPSPAFLSTSTPARTRVAEPLPGVPDIPLAPESEDLEEGEEPEEGELVDPPPRDITLPDEISAALSALRAAATGAFVPNDHLRQPVVVAAPPAVPKASYERKKRVSLGASEATPPAAPATKRVKLSYKPSPLSKPSSDAAATTAATTSTAAPAPSARAVYVRRSERSEGGTPTPENGPAQAPAPVKAVYQRRADALVAMSSTTAPNGKKNGKLRGALPLSREEKAERLPPKFYAAFGEFPTPDAAKVSTIYATPKHTVLPARNLAPPNEAALHGFWPGPPSRKQASSKAIFPAPLVPLHDDDDDRPRVEVFIDNSNVLYSFLNWVRARSDAKVTSVKTSGKDGAKSVKTVTVGGKKVKLDYRCLFAVLERGRKVERRVIVGSSTLWQSLEPAIEWGYEISLLQRVPRAENSKMSAANISAAANQLAAANGNKKRKGKAEIVVQQPVQGPSQIKHYKEQARLFWFFGVAFRVLILNSPQAVDELVHLKILQSLLDFDPPPLPVPSREPTPEPVSPAVPAPVEAVVEPAAAAPAPEGNAAAPAAKPRFQPSAAFLSGPDTQPPQTAETSATAPKPVPRFLPAGSKPPPPPKNPSIVRIVPRTRPRNRPILVIGTGDANSSEYNPGGFLGCVRRALDRGWDVEIAAFTSGISSLWTGERMRRFTEDGRPRGELRVIDLALFGEELVTV